MTAAKQLELISIDDYLAGELVSQVKHEYLGGYVYAMAGGRVVHNLIKGNIFGRLYGRLQTIRCRPYDSDMKIRVRLPTHVRFYYPDVSIICNSNPADDSYQDAPSAIFEVLSRDTRRIDEGEKKDAYLTIPTVATYILVEQESPAVVVHRRSEHGFVPEVYTGLEAVIPLPEFNTELPLSEIYDGVEFTPEKEEVSF
jgi:Uma2 family endonuclease